jgi:hypothetical protein
MVDGVIVAWEFHRERASRESIKYRTGLRAEG